MGNFRGQNMVEYVLLVAAVVSVLILFLSPLFGSPLPNTINATLNSMINQVNNLGSGPGSIQIP